MDFVKHTLWLVPLVLVVAVSSVRLLHKPLQTEIGSKREDQRTNGKGERIKDGSPAGTAFGQKNDQPDGARNKEETIKPKQSNGDDTIKWTDAWIARLTAVLALLAAVQIIAAWLQARWIRAAVTVAKEALHSTERAYVFQKAVNVEFSVGANGRPDAWHFTPQWENSGTTPTRGGTCHVSWKQFPAGTGPESIGFADQWDSAARRDRSTIFLAPRASQFGDTMTVPIGNCQGDPIFI